MSTASQKQRILQLLKTPQRHSTVLLAATTKLVQPESWPVPETQLASLNSGAALSERFAIDDVASEMECRRVVAAARRALDVTAAAGSFGESSDDASFPLAEPNSVELLFGNDSALLWALLERMQHTVEAECGGVRLAGALLNWIQGGVTPVATGAFDGNLTHLSTPTLNPPDVKDTMFLTSTA